MTTDDVIAMLSRPFTVAGDVIEVTGYSQERGGVTWVLYRKNGERHKIELPQFERYYARP